MFQTPLSFFSVVPHVDGTTQLHCVVAGNENQLDVSLLCFDAIDIPGAPMETSDGVLEFIGSEFLHLPLDRQSAVKHGGKHGRVRANTVVCSV